MNFATPVSLAAGAFSLENIELLAASSIFVPQSHVIVYRSSGTSSSFVITFDASSVANGTIVNGIVTRATGAGASLLGNSLADGNYILGIDSTKVSGDGFNYIGDAAFGESAIDGFLRM